MTPLHLDALDLRRRHPVTKLIGVALLVAVALVVGHWWVLVVVLTAVLALAALQPRPGVSSAPLRTVALAALPLGLLGGLLQLLVSADPGTAAQLAARLGLLTAAGVLFGLVTPAIDLMTAATQLHLDPRIGYVLAAAVALLPRMRERARAVVDAQQARGLALHGGPVRRVRSLVSVTGPLLLAVIAENEERAAALATRGFPGTGRGVAYRSVPFAVADATACGLLGLALVVVALLGVLGALG
ncbi:MAG: energy-coupling factor transporter transmembrane component T [Propionibacteriaceae bacterium]